MGAYPTNLHPPAVTAAIQAQLNAARSAQAERAGAKGTPTPPAPLRAHTAQKTRKTIRHDEDDLQAAIVRFFAYQYPEYAGLLFAVPNGGSRNAREGGRLKQGGVVSGVADLVLLVPRPHILLLEVKVKGGKLSDAQKAWLAKAAGQGHTTAVAFDFNAARAAIVNHIGY